MVDIPIWRICKLEKLDSFLHMSQKWENRATSLSADVGTDFGRFFGRPTTFFLEAPKLKVSLTDPPIFRGFVIGEASGDGRPMIGRHFEDFFII